MPTINGDVATLLGEDHTAGDPVALWLLASQPILTDAGTGRTGGKIKIPVASNGTFTVAGVPATSGGFPTYQLQVDSLSLRRAGQNRGLTTGSFPLTTDRDLTWIVDNYVPVTVVTTQVYADVQAAAALGATNDTATASYVANPASATKAALATEFATGGEVRSKALANGTNQSTTLQAEADALAAAGGGVLLLRSGTIVGTVTLDTNCGLRGMGVGATTLKAPNGTTGGVVKSKDFATITGTATLSPETRGAHRITLYDLTIDGNAANAASSIGVQVYGAGWRFHNLRVQSCGSHGIWTEFGQDVNFSTFTTLEGNADNIVVANNGGNGWMFRGPHDSNINNLISFGNAGWGFRNESSVGFYNGTLGHCSKFNMFLNANGWYVGDGVASYTGGQVAGAGGIGIEFKAGIGAVIMTGILVAGWTTGVIIRGIMHFLDLTVQRNTTGINIDGMGSSVLRVVGEVATTGTVGMVFTSEGTPNTITGTWNVAPAKAMTSGTPSAASQLHVVQTGGLGNDYLMQMPGVLTLPSSTELRSSRTIASTSDVMAARNTASQTTLGQFVYEGRPGLNFANDTFVGKDGAKRIGVPADHTIRTGRAVTGSRPSASTVGQGSQFFDTTLNKPIWSDGTNWRDASGTVV